MLRALHVIIDVPDGRLARSAEFWAAALGWPLGAPWPDDGASRSFEPPGAHPYVHLRTVAADDPRVRLHVEVDHRDTDADRLVGLGAVRGAATDRRVTVTSPGGLPLCLVDHVPADTPSPVTFGDHRTRLVQVCIDIPADRFADEVAFWRDATQWSWSGSDAPEFAGKLRPTPNRVQLLLQRLDAGSGPVTAHIDLGTDDRPAEVARLVALGARAGRVGGGWQVLVDPSGMEFCVTDNPPG